MVLRFPVPFFRSQRGVMQLIDELERRSDVIRIVEGVDKCEANYSGGWEIILDGAVYHITEEAFDTLLNLLRIPIKYIKRCVEDEGKFLAEASINYWLEKYNAKPEVEEDELSGPGGLGFLVQNGVDGVSVMPTITQVFPGKRLFIPGVKVNDLIFDYLEDEVEIVNYTTEDDVFNAIYLTKRKHLVGDKWYHFGVRVLYSDCFKITPRFDGVLYNKKDKILLAYPTTGRKFRVAGSTIPQVFEQIEEFLDLSIAGLNDKLLPALKDFSGNLIEVEKFVDLLCAEMRFSKKIKDEINSWFTMVNYPILEIVEIMGQRTVSLDDVELGRDIQIAMTNYITKGSFK